MNEKKDTIIKRTVYFLVAFLVLGFLSSPVFGADDDIPFFAGTKGLPNVMFIFDNSGSMENPPYPLMDDSGNKVPVPINWRWRYGVNINEDGTIAKKDNGNISYDYAKYVDLDTPVDIPSRVPPQIPGIGSLTSTMTNIRNSSNDRIYDSRIDWSDPIFTNWNKFKNAYRYYKLRIEDENRNVQFKTILSKNTRWGYWTVADNIEYDDNADPSTYTYTILTDVPGSVTREYQLEGNTGNHVYDANVDWETVNANRNDYINKVLEVTAGTNAGKSSRISSLSTDGYWKLDPGLPLDSDFSTKYKIVGSPDDDRYASGGNHPASKLYQAKKALKTFLESGDIKVCQSRDDQGNCTEYRYFLNMGFATYMSARVPRTEARYYRRKEGRTTVTPDRYQGYYKRTVSNTKYFYDNNSSTQFVSSGWETAPPGLTSWESDETHTGVSLGYQFDRLYHEDNCDEQIIRYNVTEIRSAATDSLPDRHRFKVESRVGNEGGYESYQWRSFAVSECGELPETDGAWTRVPSDDSCYPSETCKFVPGGESTTNSYYEITHRDIYGDYAVTDPETPGYVDQDNSVAPLPFIMVTPCKGFEGSSSRCISNPSPEAGDYTLVEETIYDVPINQNQDLGDIEPNIFDDSYFAYPGKGNADQPHGWSYQKTDDEYVYRKSNYYVSSWSEGIQPDPYFPAEIGEEQANHDGDDQVIFVNLPEYKDPLQDPHFGDDITGQNVAKILNYVSLARVKSPDKQTTSTERYDYTMMPYTSSIPANSKEAVPGAGTPLAATLENARKYYESYIAQDLFTQGGCRENFVILLTDGLETCDGDPEEAASRLRSISVEGTTADVKTFVIGFGLDEESKATLNGIAEAGGTYNAYFANDVEELVRVLSEDILPEISGNKYSRSAPVVSRVQREGDELKIYSAYFDWPIWRGHLLGFNINPDGSVGDPLSGWSSNCEGDSSADSDAGCEMKTFGRGTVYTRFDNSLIEFKPSNASTLKSLVNPEGKDIDGDGNANELEDAQEVIEYVLDPGYHDGKYTGTRDSGWPLGDIYNSSPVLVSGPKLNNVERSGYEEFSNLYADRPTRLYVGANDGMLHAIDDSTGREKWAYIPNAVLHKLNEFKDGHRFTVDLTIKAADVKTAQGWKTIVASGLREGGSHYYALDVTVPDDPVPLWEITDNHMGKTWSTPAFGHISIGGVNTAVVFVGGGYSTSSNKGNRLYILDALTGGILKEISVGNNTNNVPSEILTVRYQTDGYNHPIDYYTRLPVSVAWKGNIEVCYFGDTNGTLWKLVDLNSGAGSLHPHLVKLYEPENPRPVYHPPAISDEDEYCTRRYVLFGTGNEANPTGEFQNYFYEIEDREWSDEVDGAHDPAWSDEQIEAGSFRLSWRYDLGLGEQVFSDPTIYRHAVYFSTYQPKGGCTTGNSYLYVLTVSRCIPLLGQDTGEPSGNQGTGEPGGSGDDDEEVDWRDIQPKGRDGGELKTTELKDTDVPKDLGPGITSTPRIAPPKIYWSNPNADDDSEDDGLHKPHSADVPVDPGIVLYWRETQ